MCIRDRLCAVTSASAARRSCLISPRGGETASLCCGILSIRRGKRRRCPLRSSDKCLAKDSRFNSSCSFQSIKIMQVNVRKIMQFSTFPRNTTRAIFPSPGFTTDWIRSRKRRSTKQRWVPLVEPHLGYIALAVLWRIDPGKEHGLRNSSFS